MRKRCLWLAGLLLGPVLAHAAPSSYYEDELARGGYWLSVGIGGAKVNSSVPAPSAGRDAIGFSVDTGIRLTPQWGIGLDYGIVAPDDGCGGHHCTPTEPDFAPSFTRLFLIGEYRPPHDRGLRLRAGVGVSSMCYEGSAWGEFLEFLAVVLSDDYDHDHDSDFTHSSCKSLSALGGSVAVGYQWEMEHSQTSIGLQLRAEVANFAASNKAGTPAFRHRAVMLQVQLNFN